MKRVGSLVGFDSESGGLAHLARAFAWHARGNRFDSDILQLFLRAFQQLFVGRLFVLSGFESQSSLCINKKG